MYNQGKTPSPCIICDEKVKIKKIVDFADKMGIKYIATGHYSKKSMNNLLLWDENNPKVACAIKTYPDGKLTGKLRCNTPVGEQIAGYFGGGGHPYAAGFRIYEAYEATVRELVDAADKALKEYHDVETI